MSVASWDAAVSQDMTTQSILVVEDHAPTARALETVLRGAGYSPTVCRCGAEALTTIDGSLPAAAMVDIHLPDLNGLVLTQKLRNRLGPQVPIIVLSGDTSMEMLNSLQHVGATYFFSKPVSPTRVLQMLSQWLNPRG